QSALRNSLDDLTKIIERMTATEKLTNRPRTAGTLGTMGLLVWGGADPVSALLTGASAWTISQAITRPTFVRWMAGALERMEKAKAYAGNAFNAQAFRNSELNRLSQLARLDPSLREVVASLSSASRAEDSQ